MNLSYFRKTLRKLMIKKTNFQEDKTLFLEEKVLQIYYLVVLVILVVSIKIFCSKTNVKL